jgi:hypothetical protein
MISSIFIDRKVYFKNKPQIDDCVEVDWYDDDDDSRLN